MKRPFQHAAAKNGNGTSSRTWETGLLRAMITDWGGTEVPGEPRWAEMVNKEVFVHYRPGPSSMVSVNTGHTPFDTILTTVLRDERSQIVEGSGLTLHVCAR